MGRTQPSVGRTVTDELEPADFERLGAELADAQDEILASRTDLAEVRSRLLSPVRQRSSSWLWGVPAFGAVAVAILAFALTRPPEPIAFETNGGETGEGAWVASEAESRALRFSDGSLVKLAPQSGVRVAQLAAEGAQLDLQRGSMRVEVVHRDDDTRWEINAGPFVVEVIGTAFDVAWDPSEEQFAIHLDEGRVRVSGPTIAERYVEVGETVTVALGQRRMEVVSLDLDMQPEPVERLEPVAPHVEEEPIPVRPRVRRVRIDWREMVREARFTEALAIANIDEVLARGDLEDLGLLARAARHGGERDREERIYLATRTRFPATPEAADAAYRLGRIDTSDAMHWFTAYLAEAEHGPYAARAREHLMELHERGGNRSAARQIAAQYLQRHPTGPRATNARRLLEERILADEPAREAWGSVDE